MEPNLQSYTTKKTGPKFQFSPRQLRIGAIIFTFIIVAAGIWYYVNQNLFKTKAGTEDVAITFTPASDNVALGQEFLLPVRLTADASKEISGANLVITYDEGKDLVDYVQQPLPQLSSDFTDLIYQETTTVNGTKQLRITVTATTSAQLKNLTVINLKFKAKQQNGQTTFKLNTIESQVSGTAAAYVFNLLPQDKTITIGQITASPTVPPGTISPTVPGGTGAPTTTPGAGGPNPTTGPGGSQVGALYYPFFAKNWPTSDGRKQWTYALVTNPNKQAVEVTINIYDGRGGNNTPIKTLKRNIPAQQSWSSIPESAEWFSIPNTPNSTVTDGTIGWIEIIPNQSIPLSATARTIITPSTERDGVVELFEDEPFTTKLSGVSYMPVFTKNINSGDDVYKQFGDLILSNPNNTENNVTITLFDKNGAKQGEFATKIPAKGVYTTYGKQEWESLPEIIAFVKIVAQNGNIVGLNRTNIVATSERTSKIMMFDDELLVTNDKVSSRLHYPVYTKRLPTSTDQNLRQWAHIVLVNPQGSAATATVTIYATDGKVIGSPFQVQIPAHGWWNSYGTPEWLAIPEVTNGATIGWVDIQSNQPLTGINRTTFRKATGSVNPAYDNTYRADIQMFSDDTLVRTEDLISNGAMPLFLQHWPTFQQATIKQWSNLQILNPNDSPATVVVKVHRVDTGEVIGAVAATVGAKGTWGTYGRPEWNNIPFANISGTPDGNHGWMEIISDKKVAIMNRVQFRQDGGPQAFNTPMTLFGDDTDTIIAANTGPLSCDGVNCPPGYVCNGGSCFPPRCENNAQCPPGYICNGGTCFPPVCNVGFACPPGYQCKDNVCIPPRCDANNPCPPGYTCENGTCNKADMAIKLKLRFQGIVQPPAAQYNSLKVKVAVGGGGLTSLRETTATFVATEGFTWEGTAYFNGIPEGNSYYLLIKGQKHLQRKICEIDASKVKDDENGFYTCTDYVESFVPLKKGENNFDLTALYQPAGDLPINGQQDGVIDSLDLVYLRSRLGSKNAADFPTADLNLDAIIDSQDHSLPVKVLDLNKNTDDE